VTVATTATELRDALRDRRIETTGGEVKRAFVDFHCHTRFSRDSILKEETFARVAIERGLTHVVVTNHNNVEGAIAVRDKVAELGLDDRLTVILGEEVSTADGEVVGVFLQKTIPRGLSANETADEIHRQGGLVSIPHPFDPFRGAHIKEGPLRNLAEMGKIDMIEIFNCRVTFQRHNIEAAEFAARYDIPGIAASDSHSRFEIAMAFNAMPAFDSADELRGSLAENEWHGSRSTVFIHATTRWAVWKNTFDRWRGKRTAAGPILGPASPEEVRREPVKRPSGADLPAEDADNDDEAERTEGTEKE
jgi:predicted metal-dependent phosphoesterase TrpH